jgi:uncharacterized OsmC-like protein
MYKASIENSGEQQYHAVTGNYGFLMGQGGANPIDTLVASLCGCLAHHARNRLMEQKIAFSILTVKAEADLTEDKRSLAHMSVSLGVNGSKLTEAQKEDLLQQSGLCPIFNTLNKCLDIELSVS